MAQGWFVLPASQQGCTRGGHPQRPLWQQLSRARARASQRAQGPATPAAAACASHTQVHSYIALCMLRHEAVPEWEEMCAVACAVQNLVLQATALGVAGYWSSWQPVARDAPAMHQFLGARCCGVGAARGWREVACGWSCASCTAARHSARHTPKHIGRPRVLCVLRAHAHTHTHSHTHTHTHTPGIDGTEGDRCLGVFVVGRADAARVEGYRPRRRPLADKVVWKLQ
jgi:hypothetical protein